MFLELKIKRNSKMKLYNQLKSEIIKNWQEMKKDRSLMLKNLSKALFLFSAISFIFNFGYFIMNLSKNQIKKLDSCSDLKCVALLNLFNNSHLSSILDLKYRYIPDFLKSSVLTFLRVMILFSKSNIS